MVNQLNGYYVWKKGSPDLLSYHFKAGEFECPCRHTSCVEQRVSIHLINNLEAVRQAYGQSISVHSGYRCAAHQADLAAQGYETAKGISQHQLGNAADLAATNMAAFVPLIEARFKAVGLARTWLHCDLRDDKERRWTYKH